MGRDGKQNSYKKKRSSDSSILQRSDDRRKYLLQPTLIHLYIYTLIVGMIHLAMMSAIEWHDMARVSTRFYLPGKRVIFYILLRKFRFFHISTSHNHSRALNPNIIYAIKHRSFVRASTCISWRIAVPSFCVYMRIVSIVWCIFTSSVKISSRFFTDSAVRTCYYCDFIIKARITAASRVQLFEHVE